jgi:hypothetical protein
MKRKTIFLPAAALIAVALLAAANAAQAQGTLKPVEARIVNTPTQPVPVTVLSAPVAAGEGSREIYSRTFDLPFSSDSSLVCASAQLPAGRRLVVQHLSAQAVLVMASSLRFVGMGPAPGEALDLLVPAAPPLRGGSDNFFNYSVAGQQVHAYFDNQYVVCVQAVERMNRDATAQVRGYLVPRP